MLSDDNPGQAILLVWAGWAALLNMAWYQTLLVRMLLAAWAVFQHQSGGVAHDDILLCRMDDAASAIAQAWRAVIGAALGSLCNFPMICLDVNENHRLILNKVSVAGFFPGCCTRRGLVRRRWSVERSFRFSRYHQFHQMFFNAAD